MGLCSWSQTSSKPDDTDHLAPVEKLEAIEGSVQEMGTKLDILLDIMADKKREKKEVLTKSTNCDSSDDYQEVRSRRKKRLKKTRHTRLCSMTASSAL